MNENPGCNNWGFLLLAFHAPVFSATLLFLMNGGPWQHYYPHSAIGSVTDMEFFQKMDVGLNKFKDFKSLKQES